MSKSTGCEFVVSWVGECGTPGPSRCEKHAGLKCVSCKAPATHDCPETGMLVCGAPLCDDCEHETAENGTNGGIPQNMKHCRKDAQKHLPWYARTKEASESP